jgi:hypothetical protein
MIRPELILPEMRHRQIRTLFFLLPLALFCQAAQARIGETFPECEKRYGPAHGINKVQKSARFRSAGCIITIRFHEGKAEELIYVKMKNPQHYESKAVELFSRSEVDEILNANSNGEKWSGGLSEPFKGEWTCHNPQLHAEYSGILTITTQAKLDRLRKDKAKSAKGI